MAARYNTIKRLGAGNFGTCWLVQDTEDGMLGKVVKQMFIGGAFPQFASFLLMSLDVFTPFQPSSATNSHWQVGRLGCLLIKAVENFVSLSSLENHWTLVAWGLV